MNNVLNLFGSPVPKVLWGDGVSKNEFKPPTENPQFKKLLNWAFVTRSLSVISPLWCPTECYFGILIVSFILLKSGKCLKIATCSKTCFAPKDESDVIDKGKEG